MAFVTKEPTTGFLCYQGAYKKPAGFLCYQALTKFCCTDMIVFTTKCLLLYSHLSVKNHLIPVDMILEYEYITAWAT